MLVDLGQPVEDRERKIVDRDRQQHVPCRMTGEMQSESDHLELVICERYSHSDSPF